MKVKKIIVIEYEMPIDRYTPETTEKANEVLDQVISMINGLFKRLGSGFKFIAKRYGGD